MSEGTGKQAGAGKRAAESKGSRDPCSCLSRSECRIKGGASSVTEVGGGGGEGRR